MNQGMEKGRACSGSPDSYEQFHVHKCDTECVVSSVYYCLIYFAISVVVFRYLCDTFNYRMCPWIRIMDEAERKWFLNLGRTIVGYRWVGRAVRRGMVELSKCMMMLARFMPILKKPARIINSYNTLDIWGMVLAGLTIVFCYVISREVLTSIACYFKERNMLYFCVNMRPDKVANSKLFTKKMLTQLYNSPEYRRLKQQRITQGPEAWNWQTRQRLGEVMPSDEMSDDEMSFVS